MPSPKRIKGVLAPVVTPFTPDLSPDHTRLVEHCRWLLSQDCGLAVFGTNSEGNALSVDEKIRLLDCLIAADVDTARLMPGTGCCAITDTVRLTTHVVNAGCSGALMLPPFYYKGVSDEGLYYSYSEVIQRVADLRLRIYLYHIPQVSGVAISTKLIERLLEKYPGTVAGMKDSGGDWRHTKMLLDQFGSYDFDVFVGSESVLIENMRAGGVGCISATANVNPAAIVDLCRKWDTTDATERQRDLNEIRAIVAKHGMIPSLKATIAHFTGRANWSIVRPPLVELTGEQTTDLVRRLTAVGFTMPAVRPMVA